MKLRTQVLLELLIEVMVKMQSISSSLLESLLLSTTVRWLLLLTWVLFKKMSFQQRKVKQEDKQKIFKSIKINGFNTIWEVPTVTSLYVTVNLQWQSVNALDKIEGFEKTLKKDVLVDLVDETHRLLAFWEPLPAKKLFVSKLFGIWIHLVICNDLKVINVQKSNICRLSYTLAGPDFSDLGF